MYDYVMILKRHFKCLRDISCFKEKLCCTLTHVKPITAEAECW